MKYRILLTASLPLTIGAGTALAQYPGWKNTGSIFLNTTPDGANLPGSASENGFPVLVRLHADFFNFAQTNPNGEDVRFSSAAGTPLAYNIEHWDAANGTAGIWVRIPQIKGNARQELKLHWGKADAASESNGSAVFNADNGFVSVLHMDAGLKDELGAITPKDEGTVAGRGMIGEGRSFARGKGINGGDHVTTFAFGDNPLTAEAWFRSEGTDSCILYYGRYATRLNGKTGDGNEVGISIGSPPALGWASDGPGGAGGETVPRMGQWYHVAATYENGVSRIFVNGKLDGTRKQSKAMSVVKDVCMDIGGMRSGNYRFVGDIDEVRISKVARSEDWMKLAYENQNPGQTLVGPVVPQGSEFSVSQPEIKLPEGKSATVTARAGGAQKVYWLIKRDGVESIAAVDRFSFTLPAGRVTADTALTLKFQAVFADGVKSREIPVMISEDIPEPVVTLTAPSEWNGRDTIEVVPVISNLEAMKAKGAAKTETAWTVSGGAVIKEINSGRLVLKRSQFTGRITVTAAVNNGGANTVATAAIQVTEPKTDAWVPRVPDKREQPEDHQFYARDDKNEGTLFYNGTVDQPADSVFLKLYADGKLLNTEMQKPGGDRSCALTAKLKPGLIKYKVGFGTVTAGKETLLRTVNNIVCGDAYIIEGQSNAEATGPNNGPEMDAESPLSTWIRSYGNQHEGSTKGGWGNAVRTRIWGKPDYGVGQIGTWGMVLANNLVEQHRIPICIINSAYGGTPIFLHQRNPANHFDTSGEFYQNPCKIYGGLLTRVTAARLTHGIRGVFWHQGENDQGSGAPTGDYNWKSYQQYFMDMSAAWKEDFPNIRNYYVFQIWPSGCNMGGTTAGDMLLEVQRTLPSLYSNMRIMSTLGIISKSSGRGLCHFDAEGYAQIAELITPVVGQDQYGLDRSRVLTAPNLRSAKFTDAARTGIVLAFDQPMQWKDGNKKWIELDGKPATAISGKADGNLITLQFGAPGDAKSVSYISGKSWDGTPGHLLYGTNGIAALAFSSVQLGEPAK